MKLMTITLTCLTMASLTSVVKADGSPKRSPELQVLDRFADTWDMNVTHTPADGEKTGFEVVSVRTWSLGGKFMRFEDANNLIDPEKPEFQMLLTYDPDSKNYPGVMMNGPEHDQITGTWDKETSTMSFTTTLRNGNRFASTHRFIGKTRAEASGKVTSPNGELIAEMSWNQTRREEKATTADAPRAADIAANDPLEPLNRRVGTWISRKYVRKAEWTPESGTTTGEETIKWALDNKFIQGNVTYGDGTKGHWLANYDPEANVYRSWFFNNQNAFPRGETIGRWNARTGHMDWKTDLGNGFHGEFVFKYFGNDKMDWAFTVMDSDGRLMLDTGGTLTRKK